jgi:hypothetical protein
MVENRVFTYKCGGRFFLELPHDLTRKKVGRYGIITIQLGREVHNEAAH